MAVGSNLRRAFLVFLGLAVSLGVALAVSGCSGTQSGQDSGTQSSQSEDKYVPPDKPAPIYTSWVVSIVDDATSSQGGMTHTVALNLNATNPTGDKAGKYTGSATAKTTTSGSVGKGTLNAEAIANSSQLEFTLQDNSSTAGSDLAPLTGDAQVYSGKGTITMKAAGTASVGPASGGFANTSSQPFTINVTGDKVTMDITIDGKKFTFSGTISGRE